MEGRTRRSYVLLAIVDMRRWATRVARVVVRRTVGIIVNGRESEHKPFISTFTTTSQRGGQIKKQSVAISHHQLFEEVQQRITLPGSPSQSTRKNKAKKAPNIPVRTDKKSESARVCGVLIFTPFKNKTPTHLIPTHLIPNTSSTSLPRKRTSTRSHTASRTQPSAGRARTGQKQPGGSTMTVNQ